MARSRTERIANELDDAADGPSRRRGRAGRRPAAASPTPTTERQRILAEAHQTAEAAQGADRRPGRRRRRAHPARAAADVESAKAQAIADLQAEVADLAARRRRGGRRPQPRPRHPAALIDELHQPGRERQPMTRPHQTPTPRPFFAVIAAEGNAQRGRGRAVPLRPRPRGQRRAARARSPTPTSRSARRQQIVEDLLGGKALPDHRRRSSRWWSATGRVRDLPAIVDRLLEHDGLADRRRSSPRSARPSPLTDDQKARASPRRSRRPPARTSTSS